jgi:F0F1-type ATP synthase assembly protein I
MTSNNDQHIEKGPLAQTPKMTPQRAIARSYFKVILLQVLLTLCFAIPLVFFGGKLAALSALTGGAIAVVGSLIHARIALMATESANMVLLAHFGGEIAKVLATVVMFCAVLLLMKWIVLGWLLVAFAIALAGYWIALLLIK